MRKSFAIVFSSVFLIHSIARAEAPSPSSRHVIVIIFDGLRADSVSEADMPTLFALAKQGTRFADHHPVYPSSTEVNAAAIGTGGYPAHDGLVANKEYRPEVELLKSIGTDELPAIRKSDAVTNGKFLGLGTVAEILHRQNRRTAIAGTKNVALILDRAERPSGALAGSIDVYQGQTLPASELETISPDHQPIPATADAKKTANAAADRWTTRALTERMWDDGVPDLSMLWLSEPDYAQHGSGPGSDVARQALRSSDDNLAIVLKALDRARVRETTDVLVVSDHGFSTIAKNFSLVDSLKGAGFDAVSEFRAEPKAGQVIVTASGGTASLYVIGHDAAVISKLVDFLQASDFAGVIATREPAEGTFPLTQLGIDSKAAADVVVSMRWTDDRSATGVPGMLVSEGLKRTPGMGNHASLSRFDMHNTLIAAGPDFREGFVDETPSGNVDVAPTVLRLLAASPDSGADGRVLIEAMRTGDSSAKAESKTIEATRKLADGGTWRQYLKVKQIGSETYLDEGNGGQQ